MKTGMKFERMAATLPYVTEIIRDEKIKDLTARLRDEEITVSVGDAMATLLPVMLVEKPDFVIGLLGAMNGKTADEIKDQEWEETRDQMKDPACLNDMQDFFTFCLRMASNV